MPYRTLDETKITKTAERLERRIEERFPQSSLRNVARELVSLSGDLGIDAKRLAEPIWLLRGGVIAIIIGAGLIFAFVGTLVSFESISDEALGSVQGIEAAINTIVFAGIAIYTLVTLEERIKRRRALDSLHALRSIIHIIDMHQLTKDPAASGVDLLPTASSPKRTLTPGELKRYLDYCSELLSLTGKLAALYAQAINDAGVLEAVNDLETLSTNLSRKIWQKIMLIGDCGEPADAPPLLTPSG